jgi:hypothetical protein
MTDFTNEFKPLNLTKVKFEPEDEETPHPDSLSQDSFTTTSPEKRYSFNSDMMTQEPIPIPQITRGASVRIPLKDQEHDLTGFEGKVDDLLSETRKTLEDYTPQPQAYPSTFSDQVPQNFSMICFCPEGNSLFSWNFWE